MKPKTATKRKNSHFAPTKKAAALTDMHSDTDVNGSYTGTPKKLAGNSRSRTRTTCKITKRALQIIFFSFFRDGKTKRKAKKTEV